MLASKGTTEVRYPSHHGSERLMVQKVHRLRMGCKWRHKDRTAWIPDHTNVICPVSLSLSLPLPFSAASPPGSTHVRTSIACWASGPKRQQAWGPTHHLLYQRLRCAHLATAGACQLACWAAQRSTSLFSGRAHTEPDGIYWALPCGWRGHEPAASLGQARWLGLSIFLSMKNIVCPVTYSFYYTYLLHAFQMITYLLAIFNISY